MTRSRSKLANLVQKVSIGNILVLTNIFVKNIEKNHSHATMNREFDFHTNSCAVDDAKLLDLLYVFF